MPLRDEITIIGFPKCGTTALLHAFERDSDCTVLRNAENKPEMYWPQIKEIGLPDPDGTILVHKYTAYAYSKTCLNYLVETNPDRVFVICVREIRKALVSWHNFHREIATSGRAKWHFAWKERDFYATASLTDYYYRYAQEKLRYDLVIANVLAVVPPAQVAILSQEALAQDTDGVARWLKSLARGEPDANIKSGTGETHISYADRAGTPIDEAILAEVTEADRAMRVLIDTSGCHSRIV